MLNADPSSTHTSCPKYWDIIATSKCFTDRLIDSITLGNTPNGELTNMLQFLSLKLVFGNDDTYTPITTIFVDQINGDSPRYITWSEEPTDMIKYGLELRSYYDWDNITYDKQFVPMYLDQVNSIVKTNNSGGINIEVVSSIPAEPDANTLYIVRGT